MKVLELLTNRWLALCLALVAMAGALLPTTSWAAPVTMPAITIPAEDILGTAVNVFTALSPILVVVAGLGLGLYLLSKIMGFFKS